MAGGAKRDPLASIKDEPDYRGQPAGDQKIAKKEGGRMKRKANRSISGLMVLLLASAVLFFVSATIWAHGWEAPKSAAALENPVSADSASIEKGRDLFLAQCAACHGRSAAGDGPMAAALTPAPSDLTAVSGHHPDGDFFWKIEKGSGAMPGFSGRLSDKEIWHLVNYIQSLEKAR
jgi:mono/diheme cytochrome c family protein